MSGSGNGLSDIIGIMAVLVLVAANGFFVAAEFSLVAIRRSRVAELVGMGRPNARALQKAVGNLDAYLAATQLGITISSLALGWIGEPALAHLVEPLLGGVLGDHAVVGSHVASVAIAFILITALHIVLGELAPKSLALQRSEGTALWTVRPLGLFLLLLRPAILFLNGLGNLVLRLFGLRPGNGEDSLHSPEELKLLIAASQEGGLLHQAQQDVVERVFSIGDREVADIMTPRHDIDWIDADDVPDAMIRTIRDCRHDQLLVCRGDIDNLIGMVLKKDLLDQALDGQAIDPMPAVRAPLIVLEAMSVLKLLEQFKAAPVRLAIVVDEYGALCGMVTQTDLLEAIAGDLPETEGEEPDMVEREDGSFVIDGKASAHDVFMRLGLRAPAADNGFRTIAGFALSQLGRFPVIGESVDYAGWRLEIAAVDGRRIDRLHASRHPVPTP